MATWDFQTANDITTSLYFDEPTNSCWFAVTTGELVTFTIARQRFTTIGSGWEDAIAVLPAVDGLSLIAIVAAGESFIVPRDNAHRDSAITLGSIGTPAVAACRLLDGDIVVLGDDGAVRRMAWQDGSVIGDTPAVPGATALAVDEVAGQIYVAVPGAKTSIQSFDLANALPSKKFELPVRVVALAQSTQAGLVVADDTGVVSLFSTAGPVDSFTFAAPAISALCQWHSLVISAAGSHIRLVEWGDDVDTLPVGLGLDPLVPSGWVSFTPQYGAAGLGAENVEWEVDEGPFIATISLARSEAIGADVQEHRVIAGPEPVEFHIVGTRTTDGVVVARRRLRVITQWPDLETGPPRAITGVRRVYAFPGWGGGPAGPQNINAHPAPEEIQVAVAVLRLEDSKSTVDPQQRITAFETFVTGPGSSVDTYYREVSYRDTPASANPADPKGTSVTLLGGKVFGPIDVPYTWGELFTPANPDSEWQNWNPKSDETMDILAGTFSSYLLDNGLADTVTKRATSVVLAVLPATDKPYDSGGKHYPAQWGPWPHSSTAQMYWKDEFSATFRELPSVMMPAAFAANIPADKRFPEDVFAVAVAHELGHNLGCPDLYDAVAAYPAEVSNRLIGDWDLMASVWWFAHYSLPHRMMLGWINPDWVEVCDFGQNPATRTVTLQAVETLGRQGPPPGRRAGVEVRLRDGWNYYFELRCPQPGQIGDQGLANPRAIFGCDVSTHGDDYFDPDNPERAVARPLILRLPLDIDGDGPELKVANEDYEESDITNPLRMNNFRFVRLNTPDLNSVTVRIEYISAHQPELQITPAPGRGNFQSPDIILDGPAGPNVAVKGNKKMTIKVTVHNRGTKAASSVQVRVQWLPFTSAPGPWNPLPNPPTQDIPAHDKRTFEIGWELPTSVQVGGFESEHFCVRADVDRYIDPLDPAGSEITVYNNWAQSNFNTSAVGHSSPSERLATLVTATNTLAIRAAHHTLIEQTSEHFRSYVDHRWRNLEPGQTDVTQVWYESLAGDPIHDEEFQRAFRQAIERGLTNDLTARTFINPKPPGDGPIERWGAQLRISAGLHTFIDRFELTGEVVRGQVLAGDPRKPQPARGGRVRLLGIPVASPENQYTADGAVNGHGEFQIVIAGEWFKYLDEGVVAQVFYHGSPAFTPCVSEERLLRQ